MWLTQSWLGKWPPFSTQWKATGVAILLPCAAFMLGQLGPFLPVQRALSFPRNLPDTPAASQEQIGNSWSHLHPASTQPLHQAPSSQHTNPTRFSRSFIPLGRGSLDFASKAQGSSKAEAPYAALSAKGRREWERPGETSAGTRDLHTVTRDVEAGPSCPKPATPWAIEGHFGGFQLI